MAVPWLPGRIPRDKGVTAIEGVVVDQAGKPVANAAVLAYLNPTAEGRPTFVSDRTAGNGTFQLRVAGAGTYYLKVRSVLGGGAPLPGEFLNTTAEFATVTVTLAKDQILKGISLQGKWFNRQEQGPGRTRRELYKPGGGRPR